VGPLADDQFEQMGSWRAAGRKEDTISLIEGLRKYVSDRTEIVHTRGVDFTDPSKDGFAEAVELAEIIFGEYNPGGKLPVTYPVEVGQVPIYYYHKNTGPFTGDEMVQLYTRTPVASVTRPVKELRDFKRITLAPGEAATVEFMLHPSQLRFYNRDMNYVVEPGKIKIFVGTNSRDVLESEFDLR
jgi:hypothetical protein